MIDKGTLSEAVGECVAEWEETIARLGPRGLERPGACGEWRVRDVLAHFNGWDRWQLVQLRSAFSGEAPTEAELTGGVDFPENNSMAEDAMNAMFCEGNRHRPLEAVVADWREISGMRSAWVAAVSQEQLDTLIGSDWSGIPGRHLRLVSEVPNALDPRTAAQWIIDQMEHQREHIAGVRDWLAGDG